MVKTGQTVGDSERLVLPIPPGIFGGVGVRHCRGVHKGTLGLVAPQIRISRPNGDVIDVMNALIASNHVLTDFERGNEGDGVMVDSGDSGYCDRARLRAWQPLLTGQFALDIAVAEAINSSNFKMMYIEDIGEVRNQVTIPQVGMRVQKRGIGSGITTGTIEGFTSFIVNVNGNQISFDNQIKFSPNFSTIGDSGAIVVDENNALVGIITSANLTGKGMIGAISYATPWSQLGLEILGEYGHRT